jgi:hypothetical protein
LRFDRGAKFVITPDSWKPQGLISLLFAPSTIAVAAFLIGEEPSSERADLWRWFWAFFALGVVVAGFVLVVLNRQGKLVRPTEEVMARSPSRRRPIGAVVFLALAALFYGVVPATGQMVAWGLFAGGLTLFVVVANVLGYNYWRARSGA